MLSYLPSEASPGCCPGGHLGWPICLAQTHKESTLAKKSYPLVMVNFMCHLPVLRDAQIAGKASFLGVPLREILGQVSIWFGRLSKDPSTPAWEGIIQFVENLNWQKGRAKENLFSLELVYPSFPALGHQQSWCWAFDLRLGLTPFIGSPGS